MKSFCLFATAYFSSNYYYSILSFSQNEFVTIFIIFILTRRFFDVINKPLIIYVFMCASTLYFTNTFFFFFIFFYYDLWSWRSKFGTHMKVYCRVSDKFLYVDCSIVIYSCVWRRLLVVPFWSLFNSIILLLCQSLINICELFFTKSGSVDR